jgi:predicted acylesterase/phospholipase RssA
VVANAYPNIHPHLFRDEEITWQHLAASCALPLFLPQPQIGGLTFTDGGLFDSINIWAAFAMGATHVVAVNCWKPQQPWFIHRPMGWMAARRRRQRAQLNGTHPVPARKVVVIEPSGHMGRMMDGLLWHRDQIEEWRKRGQDDARAAKQSICDMF